MLSQKVGLLPETKGLKALC